MVKQILQIENTSNEDFKNEILDGVKNILSDFSKQENKQDIILTAKETAEMLSISTVTLWKYTKEHIIPAYRIGSQLRYKKSDVLLALQQKNQFEK